MSALLTMLCIVSVSTLVSGVVTDLVFRKKREAEILRILRDLGELSGQQLVDASRDGTLTRSAVYVILADLEERGLVRSRVDLSNPAPVGYMRRLRFSLTDAGREKAVQP